MFYLIVFVVVFVQMKRKRGVRMSMEFKSYNEKMQVHQSQPVSLKSLAFFSINVIFPVAVAELLLCINSQCAKSCIYVCDDVDFL